MVGWTEHFVGWVICTCAALIVLLLVGIGIGGAALGAVTFATLSVALVNRVEENKRLKHAARNRNGRHE